MTHGRPPPSPGPRPPTRDIPNRVPAHEPSTTEPNLPDDLPDLPEIPDEVFISSPSQFETLSSGLRMRILSLSRDPLSVRELAERLEMPVTSLYYHVNLLEADGFLEIVHTRKSGARLEKVYRVAGRTISPGPDLLDSVGDAAAAAKALTAIVIEPARAETEDALRKRFEGNEQRISLGRMMAVLTPDQLESLEAQIEDLIATFVNNESSADDPEAREYSFTHTLVPADHT